MNFFSFIEAKFLYFLEKFFLLMSTFCQYRLNEYLEKFFYNFLFFSHEQVVHLIHQSEDTITLKVITVDVNLLMGVAQSPHHYAPGFNGVLPNGRNTGVFYCLFIF